MQKLPEASDRKRGDAYAKKRNFPNKRKDLWVFFSSDQQSDNNLNHFCRWWRAPRVRLLKTRWLTFPQVAAVSFTSDPRLKTPSDGLVGITIQDTI